MRREDIISIQERVEKRVGYIDLSGRLMAESRYDLERILREWSEANLNQVIVTCRELEYIDSAGLSTLIGGLHKMKKLGGSLVLCSVNPALRAMFEITSIEKYFGVFENEAKAAAHLRKELAAKRKQVREAGSGASAQQKPRAEKTQAAKSPSPKKRTAKKRGAKKNPMKKKKSGKSNPKRSSSKQKPRRGAGNVKTKGAKRRGGR